MMGEQLNYFHVARDAFMEVIHEHLDLRCI